MSLIERLRTGGWSAVVIFLCIVAVTLGVLVMVLKKTSATHLTVGAIIVMLIYCMVGVFLVVASRLFVPVRPPNP